MPANYYFKITIDGQDVDLSSIEDLPVSISYKLEDRVDFQVKESSTALSIKVPASLQNDFIFNSLHNPAVEDLTAGSTLSLARPVVLVAGGDELIVGKCILDSAEHNDKPVAYEFDIYGGNADWMIDLKETSFHDLLKSISFLFTKPVIEASWSFDGTSEALPYVFAPIRYLDAFGELDQDVLPIHLKPSLSKYWILYWGFKSVGYRLKSDFFDTSYFRRQVMPWSWGSFLYSEGTQMEALDFLAKSTTSDYTSGTSHRYMDLHATNDYQDGGFDNNGVYSYSAPDRRMDFKYLASINLGTLDATFHVAAYVDATVVSDSSANLYIEWYKNGTQIERTIVLNLVGPTIGRDDFVGVIDSYKTVSIDPDDVVSVKFYCDTEDAALGRVNLRLNIDAFELEYTRVPSGGTINFANFLGLKKWKFLDLLRGIVDEFNLQVATDSLHKVVTIEPLHPYSLTHDLSANSGGYLKEDWLDWNDKQDLTKTSKVTTFRDGEREQMFRYKEDSNDGLLKKVQDRNQNTVGAAKYVLPERFKSGKKDAVENRFFSPVMHVPFQQWKDITGVTPQMVVMVPENIANTSRGEAQNTFAPKSAYYKGLVTDAGGWRFDGEDKTEYPYLFAVNYQDGGQSDPILSYSDEQIGTTAPVIGKGLLRRFYLQRMANMRLGKNYTTYFNLQNVDVTNWLHREFIICRNDRYELVEINSYTPLKQDSTGVFLRKWTPMKIEDSNAVFPALLSGLTTSTFEMKYAPLMCLPSDVPKQQ